MLTESKDYIDNPVNILDSSTGPLAGLNSLSRNHNNISESFEQCKVEDSINTITVN